MPVWLLELPVAHPLLPLQKATPPMSIWLLVFVVCCGFSIYALWNWPL